MSTTIINRKLFSSTVQGSSRLFSTSAPRCSRRQVLVELLDDVNGLGQIYDRMTMNPGRARNELVPNGLARIVPWKRNVDRSSDVANDKLSKRAQILQARKFAPISQTTSSTVSDAQQVAVTPGDLLASLNDLPPSFVFARRTISTGAESIHGSLTLTDIATRLQEDHGLSPLSVEVYWRDARLEENSRIRAIGSYDAVVRVKGMGQEEAPLSIEVTPLLE